MEHKTTITVAALIATLFWSFAACSKQVKVVNIEDDDYEMVAAIAKARSTLPEFWRVFDKPERGESQFSLKVKITDKNGTEHFWATDIEQRDGKTTGTLNNEPNLVASVKFGDRIEISEADISDWLYVREGKMVGNRTIVPLLKTLPAKEADAYRKVITEL